MVTNKFARLLVVEDEIITARDLQDSLEELGYDVPDIASSGKEALEMAEALRPDLVLMDINLGANSRDGVETAAELRARLDLPVIYLTAYADQATLDRASATAPLGYLTKPFERRELNATIQMALVKRQLDEQLQQSESWYSTSLSCIGDGVIATDTQGNVKFLNPVAESLTGWSHVEACGRPLDEVFALYDGTSREKLPSLAARVLADDRTIFLEGGAILRSQTGAFVPVDDSAAPIRNQRDGVLLGVVIVFRDVREKQQVAAELERARRLESLGTLAGGLAHDLNNILAIIAGHVSLAAQPGAALEMQTRAFAKIDSAVSRAKALTSQFLTFSKGGEPIRRRIDLRALLAEEIDLVFEDADAAAMGLGRELQIAADLWTVEADEGQVRRVAENFLRNAMQSLPAAGGRITARAFNCAREALPGIRDARETTATHFVALEIGDTGCGISPENLDHVCDPYFTTRPTGSGLGLSVCHSIVRKHGGFLHLISVPGEGTTATAYLPAQPPESPSAPAGKPEARPVGASSDWGSGRLAKPEPPARKLRVLAMDDEPMMCELLAKMLDCLGHGAVTAQTGEEALRLYDEAAAGGAPFDLVSIDLVNKLGMGGEEMIKRLRQKYPGVIALVCSGYSDHPIMANFRSYGFSGCLPKPVSLQALRAGIELATRSSEKAR